MNPIRTYICGPPEVQKECEAVAKELRFPQVTKRYAMMGGNVATFKGWVSENLRDVYVFKRKISLEKRHLLKFFVLNNNDGLTQIEIGEGDTKNIAKNNKSP